MRSKTACFTGHRIIPKQDRECIKKRLNKAVIELLDEGVVNFVSGFALGFDLMAAEEVLRLKESYPQARLIAALPCTDQNCRWAEEDRLLYQRLLDRADEVVYVSKRPYFNECMKIRNKYLVEVSRVCVAYFCEERPRSGTGQTVRLAKKDSCKVVNLASGEVYEADIDYRGIPFC